MLLGHFEIEIRLQEFPFGLQFVKLFFLVRMVAGQGIEFRGKIFKLVLYC